MIIEAVRARVARCQGAGWRTSQQLAKHAQAASPPVRIPANTSERLRELPADGLASGPADVQIVWRADLGEDAEPWADEVAVCPPAAGEAIGILVWAPRAWLAQTGLSDMAGVEGEAESAKPDRSSSRSVLCWFGRR